MSYSTGVSDRIPAALDVLRGDDSPGALGRVKAAIDHLERRQREAEADIVYARPLTTSELVRYAYTRAVGAARQVPPMGC